MWLFQGHKKWPVDFKCAITFIINLVLVWYGGKKLKCRFEIFFTLISWLLILVDKLKRTLHSFSYTNHMIQFSSVQSLSCPTLCDPINCSTPGLPVHHQLLEFTHTHVHQVHDAIQQSHQVKKMTDSLNVSHFLPSPSSSCSKSPSI